MAGKNRNAQMVDDTFTVFAGVFKFAIFLLQMLLKISVFGYIAFYFGLDWMYEFFPKGRNTILSEFGLKTFMNPFYMFCLLWSIVHYMDEEYGGEIFLASSALSCAGLVYFEKFSFTDLSWFRSLTWYGAIFGIFVVIGIIFYTLGSIKTFKSSVMGIGRFFLYVFLQLPMQAIDYVYPPLYEYIVKKVSLRLDVNFRFKEKPYIHTEGEVDPRDGRTFYQSTEWRKLRYKAFEKYGTICLDPHCNNQATHVDHVKPRSLRPDLALDINNLQVLCEDCNRIKSNKSDVDFRNIKKKQ